MNAYPTNNLTEAGILIHTFDGHLNPTAPWTVKSYGWMTAYSRILSTSLINNRKAGLFNHNGAVILSPATTIFCSYPYDGGAMNYWNGCGPSMCSEPHNIWGCAFPPHMLYRMMITFENGPQWPYNEVVVDAYNFVIEAFVGGRGGDVAAMHQRTLEHFGLQANQLPLLAFGGHDQNGPFICVVCS